MELRKIKGEWIVVPLGCSRGRVVNVGKGGGGLGEKDTRKTRTRGGF